MVSPKAILGLFVNCWIGFLVACSSVQTVKTDDPLAGAGSGTLEVRANGEDFIRQGFVSKDGWQLTFDRALVSLGAVTAYQTDPPYDPQGEGTLEPRQTVTVVETAVIDLAAGDQKAAPIPIGQVPAPPGRYNALSWKMPRATSGESQGYVFFLRGKASQGDKNVSFTLKLEQELGFVCGDYVGDDRKGMVEPGKIADLEATFHFDHLFGDAGIPRDDALNQVALGFAPLAALAKQGTIVANLTELKAQLSPADYDRVQKILPSLGHVGEGHCKETLGSKSA